MTSERSDEPTMGDLINALPKDGTPMRVVTPYGVSDVTYHGALRYDDDWHTVTAKPDPQETICPKCGSTSVVRSTMDESDIVEYRCQDCDHAEVF